MPLAKLPRVIGLCLLLLLSGCQTLTPPLQVNPHWQTQIITQDFKHLIIRNPWAAAQANPARLHVYIEGDGIPYVHRLLIAKDPTPQYPMLLNMMAMDSTASIYLSRPCYFNNAVMGMMDSQCNFHYWTDARYSEKVVDDMVNTLTIYIAENPANGITLIGHSGGGTLALLMAARMPNVDQLVTLAANVDTAAWTKLHNYNAMKSSLNPAAAIVDLPTRHQLHFVGGKDDNIPPALSREFFQRMGQKAIVLKDADHTCCWQTQWPALLQQIVQQITNTSAARQP